MALHQSALSTFRTCEQQWAYEHIGGLEALYPGIPLGLGAWVHALLAARDLSTASVADTLALPPPTVLDVPDEPMQVYRLDNGRLGLRRGRVEGACDTRAVLAASRHWWNREASDVWRDDFSERYGGRDLPEHLSNILDRYDERWEVDDEHYDVLGVEVEWTRAVRDSGGTVHRLQGRVDEVLRDRRYGLVVLRDRKTHGQWPSEHEFVLDLLDAQLHLYAWGLAPMLEDAGVGGVGALQWDRIRTKPPTEPKVTQAGNLSKSVTDFDLYTYVAWATALDEDRVEPAEHRHYPGRKKDGSEAGVYSLEEDVLEALSQPEARDSFFRRRQFPVNETTLRRHVAMALRDNAKMHGIDSLTDANPSPGRHCSWCDFLRLCHGQMFGEVGEEFDPADYALRLSECESERERDVIRP